MSRSRSGTAFAIIIILVSCGGLTACDDAKAAGALTAQGSYSFNNNNICSYTTDSLRNASGDHTITQTQSQGVSGVATYEAGKFTAKFVVMSFGVRAKLRNADNSVLDNLTLTRATSKGTCEGTFTMGADNVLTNKYHCTTAAVEGFNTGTTTYVKSIDGRAVVTEDGIMRQVDSNLDLPAPSEEALFTWPTGTQIDTAMLDATDDAQPLPQAIKDLGVTRAFRMCSRLGTSMKL